MSDIVELFDAIDKELLGMTMGYMPTLLKKSKAVIEAQAARIAELEAEVAWKDEARVEDIAAMLRWAEWMFVDADSIEEIENYWDKVVEQERLFDREQSFVWHRQFIGDFKASEHHGDCTKEPIACLRCEAEKWMKIARAALNTQDNGGDDD